MLFVSIDEKLLRAANFAHPAVVYFALIDVFMIKTLHRSRLYIQNAFVVGKQRRNEHRATPTLVCT